MTEKNLTAEQERVAEAVIEGRPGRVVVLRGYAGTGKTYLASRIINSGKFTKPVVVAPTAVALNALKRKFAGNVPADTTFNTFAYLTSRPVSLLKVGKYPKSYTVRLDDGSSSSRFELSLHDFVTQKSPRGKDLSDLITSHTDDSGNVRYEADTASMQKMLGVPVVEDVRFDQLPSDLIYERLLKYDLVVIDEYSMIDEKKHELVVEMAALFETENKGPVFLVCGDAGQLQPVNAVINSAIQLEPDGYTVFELTKPMRSDDEIANFASRLRNGAKLSAMAASPNKRVQSVSGSVHEIFQQNEQVFADADIVLTWKNSNVEKLNTLMRAQRGFSGDLSAGESVVVTQNVYSGPGVIDWAKGEIMEVSEVKPGRKVAEKLREEAPKVIARWRERAEALAADAEDDDDPYLAQAGVLEDRASALEETYEEAALLLEGEVALLVELTDGFDTNTSTRMALVDAKLSDARDQQWRERKYILRAIGWLFGAKVVDLAFAYALTVHKAQGSELDSVVYLTSSGEVWAQGKKSYDGADWHAPYTAVTRARKNVKVLYSPASKLD